MTSYNSVNGKPMSGNDDLLLKTLKQDWGFKGFVISDAGAVGGALVLHNTAKDYPESGEQAINGGLDVIFQTDYDHYKLFIPPFLDGKINAGRLDDAVARVLRAKFELGLFEDPYVKVDDIERYVDMKRHRDIAREAAAGSFVLLKRSVDGLPLKNSLISLAIIGSDAVDARLGGYSGPGVKKVSILDAIHAKYPTVKTNYAAGYDRHEKGYTVVPAAALKLKASYFANTSFEGKPAFEREDKQINFHWTLFSPDDNKLIKDNYSVRWTGTFTAPVSGTIRLGVEGNDGYRLLLDGKVHVDRFIKQSYHTDLKSLIVEKGKTYSIQLDFSEPVGNATVKLIWDVNVKDEWKKRIEEAVAAANKTEEVVVAVGIHEGEFQDRAYLNLPWHQEELIEALVKTGKPVHVLLVGGSAITMDKWIDKVKSVVLIWYPGEAGGDAVADMLFGNVNPSGKLPITFPIHESQLPLTYNHLPTGRGDDYHNLTGLPLFPFGFGLSYTSFEYRDLKLSKNEIKLGESVELRFTLKNTGTVKGSEVVQLYLRDELSSIARPVMELKGFQKIELKAGEEKELRFVIDPSMLKMLNAKGEAVIEPGLFRVMIGGSSRDLPLKVSLKVN